MNTLGRFLPFGDPGTPVVVQAEDRLLGGNFHRGFAAWLTMWYMFGNGGLGHGLVTSAVFGLITMTVAAMLEGSRTRLANRGLAYAPSIVARVVPFKMFGYFVIVERALPLWIPTWLSHDVPPEMLEYYNTIRSWLAQ